MQINKYQLFCLIMLFEIGSSTLFALGIDAKQDAWIAIIISMFIAIILMCIYVKLCSFFPEKNLIDIIITVLGKFIGMPLAFIYGLFFLYCSIRNLHDFGILMQMTFLHKTPLVVIHAILMLVEIYIIFLGLKVLARTGQIMFWAISFFILTTFILIIFSAKLRLDELIPVLNNGFGPVLKAVYPSLVNFPYGEVFVFSMFWCYVDKKKDLLKTSILAICLATILFIASTLLTICALGVEYTSIATIPLLDLIKMINIGEILTNLDAVGVIIMFIGGFYKMLLFFYGGVLAFNTLFKKINIKLITIICGIFVTWYATIFEPSYAYHIWLGHKVSLPYIHNTFQVLIPPILLLICFIKSKIPIKKL
jgi:spore germination protein KB